MKRTLIVKVARSNEGLVDLWLLKVGVRSTTEALPLVWKPKRTALAKFEDDLMVEVLKRLDIMFAKGQVVVFV